MQEFSPENNATDGKSQVKNTTDNMPLISIIVPIYNVEKFIRKCLESLHKQTYERLEILLIDDGSPDNSVEICKEFAREDSRMKIFHKKNGGLSDARNYGIHLSEGEYITCVDSDDYIDVDYVEYLYSILDKYKTKMSICQHRVHYRNGKIKDARQTGDEVLETFECLERMLYHDVIDTSACAKLYHRSLFKNVSYPVGKLFEDIGTTYALMLQCEDIAVGYEAKYNYIFHENSIVNGEFKLNKLDMLEMTDKMAVDVVKYFPTLENAALRRRVYARFSTLNQMLYTNGFLKERQEIISFISQYSGKILSDAKAPKRDKIAILLLKLNYRVYRGCWLMYRKHIMTDGKECI